jgi:hypothetical protein
VDNDQCVDWNWHFLLSKNFLDGRRLITCMLTKLGWTPSGSCSRFRYHDFGKVEIELEE